jgi:hypothetical protein
MSKHSKIGLVTLILLVGSLTVIPVGARKTVIRVPGDYVSIEEAVDVANPGDVIKVGRGEYAGCYLYKQVTIVGCGGTVINSGPVHGSGLIQGFRLMTGSDGSTFRKLTFTVDFAIMNGGAVDDVEVSHCTFLDTVQAVSNWGGCGWDITHNRITDLRTHSGGGIGILVADRFGGTVTDNLVAHNKITGTLHVWESDGGGYSGSGIVLYADFRWGMAGAEAIYDNVVRHNKVSLVSDNPEVVDVVAFELTDTRDDPSLDTVIYDNYVCFNDFRGTEIQIALTPPELEDYNTISRNLGERRGHGLHPKIH